MGEENSREQCRFRILSIDGGGIKGVFPAAFLAELEKALSVPIYKYFDLIAGTSTGAIIALGLGLGKSAAEITQFYREYGPAIFGQPTHWWSRFGKPKHPAEPLRQALEEVFGNATLGDSKVRLLIPSFNTSTGEIHLYKTRHHQRFWTDHRESVVGVALATTAAPFFFPSHKGAGGAIYLDGGIWANNPVGNAAVEAITWIGQSAQNTIALSIGCTQFPSSYPSSNGMRSAVSVVEAALRAQSGGSLGIAYSILGHNSVKRVNPVAPPGTFGLDKISGIDELAAYAYIEARRESSELIPMFFKTEAAPFIPVPLRAI
jgi:uncharacterized protein